MDSLMQKPRQILYDAALGAGLGAVLVMSLLAFDVLNLATLVWQIEHSALFLAMMVFKPMLVFGSAGAGWSVLRRPTVDAPSREAELRSDTAQQELAYRTS